MTTAGKIDNTFPHGLLYGFNKNVHDVKIQSDGKPVIASVVASTYNGYVFGNIKRLNPNGTIDPSFTGTTNNNQVSGGIESLEIQPDGKIVVGGAFTTANTQTLSGMVRFTSGGTVDNTFNAQSWISTYNIGAIQKIKLFLY